MKDKLRDAFDMIRADDALKGNTQAFVARKTRGYTRAGSTMSRRLLPAALCLLLGLFAGRWLYFTPTVAICIDLNPSLELEINRFDRVVSVNGYNDDGRALADTLALTYLDYREALERVLQEETVATLLAQDGTMAIGVIGAQGAQSARILSNVRECTAAENAYCYAASAQELEAAHELGLSYGKYRAFLEMQALDPAVTPEEVRGMSMREIRDWIAVQSSDGESDPQAGDAGSHGQRGNGYGRGQGNGRGPAW